MKIKNCVQAISADISVVIMCFGILIACPIRIFQMIKNIDPVTGFFDDYSNITVAILYALLVVASALILLLTFLSGRIPAALAPKGRRIPLGIASLIFAATLFYDAVQNYLPQRQGTATIVQNAHSLSTLHHAHAIFAFLSCCYFIAFCISYISGNSVHKKLKLLSLAPLVWSILRVLERITVIISIVRVSELLLELCAFVFLMLFFLTFARVVSEVNCKGSMWSVIACGCVSALFILTYSIPRVMLMVTGNSESLVSGYPVNFADIGCALFIIIFIVTTLRSGYKVADVKKMYEEILAQEALENELFPAEEESVPVVRDQSGNIKIARDVSTEQEETTDESEETES